VLSAFNGTLKLDTVRSSCAFLSSYLTSLAVADELDIWANGRSSSRYAEIGRSKEDVLAEAKLLDKEWKAASTAFFEVGCPSRRRHRPSPMLLLSSGLVDQSSQVGQELRRRFWQKLISSLPRAYIIVDFKRV